MAVVSDCGAALHRMPVFRLATNAAAAIGGRFEGLQIGACSAASDFRLSFSDELNVDCP